MELAANAVAQAGSASTDVVKKIGLLAALAVLAAIVLMPPSDGLPQAGQVMLGVLAFFAVSMPSA